jgi:hypothetical protein
VQSAGRPGYEGLAKNDLTERNARPIRKIFERNRVTRYILLGIFFLILTGCGGGSGSGSQASSAQICGLTVIATANYQSSSRNSGSDGAMYVDPLGRNSLILTTLTNGAIIDFTAPDGNIAAFSMAVYDANGLPVFTQQGPIASIANMTNGKIVIYFPATASLAAGNYSCRVTVSDLSGHISNSLFTNFTVS